MLSRKEKQLLVFLTAACFLLRLCVAFLIHITPTSDAADYVQLANNLIQGKGFSLDGKITAYRPPAYPFFLAGIFSFAPSLFAARIAQAVFETITAVSLFVIGKNIFSVSAGFLAMLIWVFFPVSILQVPFLYSEPLFVALITVSFALLFDRQKHTGVFLFTIGILWGIAVLTKPQSVIIPIVYLSWLAINKEDVLQLLKKGAVLFVGIMLIVSPWIVRNMMEFHRPIIVSNGGINFWIGNNEHATGGYFFPKENNPLANIHNEIEASDVGYTLGMQFILHHPFREVYLLGMKTAHLFTLESATAISLSKNYSSPAKRFKLLYRETSPFLLAFINIPYIIVLLLGVYGFAGISLNKTSVQLFLLMFILGWIAVHLPFFGINRFNYPLLPMFVLSTAYACTEWNAMKKNLSVKKRLIAGVCIFFLLVVWFSEYVIVYVL